MMSHPMHLHGCERFEDERPLSRAQHTINMPPGTQRSYSVTADALAVGRNTAICCFHMDAGMFPHPPTPPPHRGA